MNTADEGFCVFVCVVVCAGRSPACQRSATCREWGVTLGKVQPRVHGDAAQVHVYGREPQRDDPACCPPSLSTLPPGRSVSGTNLAASPHNTYSSSFCAFLAPLWSACHSIEQFSHRCWLFIVWVPFPRCVRRFSLTEVRATPPGEAVSLHRGTKEVLWAYHPSLCVFFCWSPYSCMCAAAELNKGGDIGVLVLRVTGIWKVGWIPWCAKPHAPPTWLWLLLLLFLSLRTEPCCRSLCSAAASSPTHEY